MERERRTMNIKITSEMREQAKFVYHNHHARTNAVSNIKLEVFKQVYGRYPEVVEIWDYDKEVEEQAKSIENQLFNEYLNGLT